MCVFNPACSTRVWLDTQTLRASARVCCVYATARERKRDRGRERERKREGDREIAREREREGERERKPRACAACVVVTHTRYPLKRCCLYNCPGRRDTPAYSKRTFPSTHPPKFPHRARAMRAVWCAGSMGGLKLRFFNARALRNRTLLALTPHPARKYVASALSRYLVSCPGLAIATSGAGYA